MIPRCCPLALLALLASFACAPPPPPVCGDGIVAEGETEATCCQDTGCGSGVCTDGACQAPWLESCAGHEGECLQGEPRLCVDDGPPRYDCASCACAGGVCLEGVCTSPRIVEAVRDLPDVPDDLPVEDYFELLDRLAGSQASAYADYLDEEERRIREDPRRAAVLLGLSGGSTDESALSARLLRDLEERGLAIAALHVEQAGGAPILEGEHLAALAGEPVLVQGGSSNAPFCQALEPALEDRLVEDGLVAQAVSSGRVSPFTCLHEQHWPVCLPPHTGSCALRAGRLPETLVLFDADPWLARVDRALLNRAGRAAPSEVVTQLDMSITRFRQAADALPRAAFYEVDALGRTVDARLVRIDEEEGLAFAYLPRPGRKAYLLQSFRVLWRQQAIQSFLLQHDIVPGDCAIDVVVEPPSERVLYRCEGNDGAVLEAEVDAATSTLVSSSTSGP